MNDIAKPPVTVGILFGMLVSIELWCGAALLMSVLT